MVFELRLMNNPRERHVELFRHEFVRKDEAVEVGGPDVEASLHLRTKILGNVRVRSRVLCGHVGIDSVDGGLLDLDDLVRGGEVVDCEGHGLKPPPESPDI